MKYYKPDITEFYVGFEYEEYSEGYTYDVKLLNPTELQVLSEPLQTTEWVKRVYELQDFVTFIDGELAEYIPEVRVKFLDEQDIKELGWILNTKNVKYNYGVYYKLSHQMTYSFNFNDCEIIDYNLIEHKHLFQGTIKNKSELKKIMAQLGIEI